MLPKSVLNHFNKIKNIPHPHNNKIVENRQIVWAFGAGCYFSNICCKFVYTESGKIIYNFFSFSNPPTNKFIFNDVLCYNNVATEMYDLTLKEMIYATEMFYRCSLCHESLANLLLKVGYKLMEEYYISNPQDLGYLFKWIKQLVEQYPHQFEFTT